MLTNKECETLTQRLYETLTVLPLSSLLTDDNLKNVVLQETANIVENADGNTDLEIKESTINDKLITKICNNFYPLLFTPIIVNQRPDGSYFIVDGLHRLFAAQAMGWTTIPCYVLQIPCGEEYAIYDEDDEFVWSGGFVTEDDIRISLTHDLDNLLKALQ